MGNRLQGKVAFITGGGSGIGAATALRFAEEGATVVICGRRRAPLDEVVARIEAAGGRAEGVCADVGDEAQIVAAIEGAAQRHGRLDVLVNNAMAYTWGALDSTATDAWHANFTTSVDGTFWGTRPATRPTHEPGAALVRPGAICGTLGTAWMAGYSAAKAAIINFSRAAAAEGAAANIRGQSFERTGIVRQPHAQPQPPSIPDHSPLDDARQQIHIQIPARYEHGDVFSTMPRLALQ